MKTIYKYLPPTNRLFILLLLLLLSSCGTRKVATQKATTRVELKEESTNKVDSTSTTKQEVNEKEVAKQTEQADVTQKDVTTQVKEVFTPDGALVERTTTTTISDKVDRTKKEATTSREIQANTLKEATKQVVNTAKKVVDSLVKEHQKEVKSKKGAGLWIWVVGILVLSGAGWYWIRKRSIL